MMLKILLPAVLLISSAMAADAPVAAAPVPPKAPVVQQAGYNFVGVSLGIAKPNNLDTPTIGSIPFRFAYAAEYSYAFSSQFSAGLYASRNNGEVVKGVDVNLAFTRVGFQATYSPIYDAFIDLKAGLTFIDGKINLGNGTVIKFDTDQHPIFISPGFGIVIPVAERIQIVPNLHYTYFLSNSDIESFQMFDLMATVRLQF